MHRGPEHESLPCVYFFGRSLLRLSTLFSTAFSLSLFTLIQSTYTVPAASASQMLFGQVECCEEARTDQFEYLIRKDRELPCWVKVAIPRLTRVASDQKLRTVVWKRMCRQELFYANQKQLDHIKELADSCNMSLE